jgi:hypothetical protein
MRKGIFIKERRIDTKSSRTAGFTCMYRAASYLETNVFYKSDDYIAPKLLPFFIKFIVKHRLVNFHWSFFPKGIYEYVISRTKYIDNIIKKEIEKSIDQIICTQTRRTPLYRQPSTADIYY